MSLNSSILGAVAAIALVAPAANAASGGWMISGTGGLTVPTGDFSAKDQLDASAGFGLGGSIDYGLTPKFALGVGGSWNRNKHDEEGKTVAVTGGTAVFSKDKFDTWQFDAHGKYMLPTSGAVGSYLLLGLGVYNTTENYEGTVTPTGGSPSSVTGKTTTDSRFGGKFGVGSSYKLNQMWSLGAEANYNFISEDKDKTGVSALQYLDAHAMLTLNVMPK